MFCLLSCTHEIYKVPVYKFIFYISLLLKDSKKNKIGISHSKVKEFEFKEFDYFYLYIIFKHNFL